mgnify:CR=1 FL=1
MTVQNDLERVWASTGAVTDPNAANYAQGWLAEIPTFQEFNYVLRNATQNTLSLAERGVFVWQVDIAYRVGAEVDHAGITHTCIIAHTGITPSNDTYWTKGTVLGTLASNAMSSHGVLIRDVNTRAGVGSWSGNEITLQNTNAVIAFNIPSADNWLLHNVNGEMGVTNVTSAGTPDGRAMSYSSPNTHRLYHEGHPPTQSEVANTIPANPNNSTLYARRGTNWVAVTANVISDTPPDPVTGTGTGWYNLEDGQYYLDIDDGDSSQWVTANPPLIPENVWTEANLNPLDHDGVGTMGLFLSLSSVAGGTTVAGSSLLYAQLSSAGNVVSIGAPAGTWRNLYRSGSNVNAGYLSTYVRIA